MSDLHLPADIKDWPRDPFQLLGIAPGLDAKEVRRAYTRLIRRFKPEQCPEQFRRIREAYESALQFNVWFPQGQPLPFGTDLPPPENGPAVEFTPEKTNESSQEDIPLPAAADVPIHVPREDAASIWTSLGNGNERETYQKLRTLYESQDLSSEIPQWLYWLLVAQPELDPQRHPCDWLARGLRDHALHGSCGELYRREVEERPLEALTDRYRQLLDSPVHPQSLEGLVRWRWQAAGTLGNHQVFADDFELLGARFSREDGDTWMRLLLFAADQLAWFRSGPGQAVFGRCRKLIDEHGHLHLKFGDALTRLDQLREVVAESRAQMSERPELREFFELMPVLWTQPMHLVRFELLNCLGTAARKPRDFLGLLDTAQAVAPFSLAHFGQSLSWIWAGYRPEEPRDPADINWLIANFLEAYQPGAYHYFRRHLLDFFLEEHVFPDAVASAWEQHVSGSEFVQNILLDWPLQYTCMAHDLIWQ